MQLLRNSTRILSGTFILPLALSAQTFSTLYSFGSQGDDGDLPGFGVVLGSQGELYGVTSVGGRWDLGTVYELLPPSSPGGVWTEVVLHSFNGASGLDPNCALAMGPNGSLYGVADSNTGEIAFKLDPPTGTSTDWAYALIYQFTEANGGPSGGLVFGSPRGYGQSLYGATGVHGETGTVYRLTPPMSAGGTWTQTTLYTFLGGSGGSGPLGSLAVGNAGTLFGVTSQGGRISDFCGAGCGTAFSLTPPAVPGGPSTEEVLHAFNPQVGDGYTPFAGLVIGPGGVLYGTTADGGTGGVGTVFSLTPPVAPGAPMTYTTLHAFTEFEGDGYLPDRPLVLGSNGALYGTTEYGGAEGHGTVFELVPPASPGGIWTETILHSFTGGADGGNPNGLTLGPDGTLYGTNNEGGANGVGTVFALTP
jgi:uncharacterized repeat protein (TIGR03803 family)